MHPAAIGPFKIERELGRGGMGVVYLATDTRLDRRVAIKALPADLAADPDRLARFQREAKVLAALNHPNVGGIHGLEQADGHQYLVLEYIEGETLADRLAAGPIPVADSLALAKQIAEALEAAHEKGVIHRDLKPGNVMVTSEGVVKVLDFGLARTTDGSPSSTNAAAMADSPTISSPARHSPTIPGAIMGTAGYMSPEQARGKPVDKRSDIFSFGCVLYEMLTGVMPFRGETVADSIGATLHKESDFNLLPATTPRRVRDLLANCLAKDRRNRLHDIGDARLELERAMSGQEWTTASIAEREARSTPLRWVLAAAAGVLLLGAGWFVGRSSQPAKPSVPVQAFHVSTSIPSKPSYSSLVGIAPDATFVIYVAQPELEPDSSKPVGVVMVRRLDRDETTMIEGTEGAMNAALSPDGRWVVFPAAKDRTNSKFSLKKVSLEHGRPTGKPQTICDLTQGTWFNVGWASDRDVVFSVFASGKIYTVPAAGGETRSINLVDAGESIEGWSDFQPLVAGQSILATHYSFDNDKVKVTVEAIDLASAKRTVVLRDAQAPRLATDWDTGGKEAGPLLLASRSDLAGLIAVRFDPSTLQTIGDPVTVWNGGQVNSFFLSPSGTLAMSTQAAAQTNRRLACIDDKGQPQSIPIAARAYSGIAISSDEERVLTNQEATTSDDLNSQVLVLDLTRKTSARVPIDGVSDAMIWNNDGRRIVYNSFSNDEFSIWERPAVGSGEAVKILANPFGQRLYLTPNAWSPDGKILAVTQQDIQTNKSDVLMLEQGAEGSAWKATPYLNSAADEHALRFSPDGKWVIFCSFESGRHELYVQPFTGASSGAKDAANGRVQISTTGHDGMTWWSPDGKEIRFVDGDRQIMSVEVKTDPTFSASLPKALYSLKDLKTRNFTWAPDGRLMVILEGENERVNKIDLIVNFMDEVRAKLGAKK